MANADAYLVKFTVGNEGEPGAPVLHVSAVVDPSKGTVNGSGEITQAVDGPVGDIHISHITGEIHPLGYLLHLTRVVALKGSFIVPPTGVVQPFSATLMLEPDAWTGQGTFKYGSHTVANVPVTLDSPGLRQAA